MLPPDMAGGTTVPQFIMHHDANLLGPSWEDFDASRFLEINLQEVSRQAKTPVPAPRIGKPPSETLQQPKLDAAGAGSQGLARCDGFWISACPFLSLPPVGPAAASTPSLTA